MAGYEQKYFLCSSDGMDTDGAGHRRTAKPILCFLAKKVTVLRKILSLMNDVGIFLSRGHKMEIWYKPIVAEKDVIEPAA